MPPRGVSVRGRGDGTGNVFSTEPATQAALHECKLQYSSHTAPLLIPLRWIITMTITKVKLLAYLVLPGTVLSTLDMLGTLILTTL